MKYRTKLFVSFTSLVLISSLLTIGISYQKSRSLLFNQIRSQLLSIAVSSATSIDGDTITTTTPTDVNYTKLINQLRFIRDSNRRPDLFLTYVYIVRRINHANYIFVADAEEDPKNVSLFGDPFQPPEDFQQSPYVPFAISKEIKDKWGSWFSAYAPIYNSHQKIAGYLGVDLNSKFVEHELNKLFFYSLLGFIVTLSLGFIVANFLSKKMTKALAMLCNCVEDIGSGNLKSRIYLDTEDELEDLGNVINTMAKDLEEKERLTANFGRYISHHVLEKIIHSNINTKIEGEKRKVSILFSDIRQFTTLSESLPPEHVVCFLNEYFENMIEIIFKYHGTLDKFLGDGLMAEFGIPLDDPYQELNAVKTAIEMQRMVKTLCKKWQGTQYENIKIGIGIHTGLAIVGNIGSSKRMEYTAVGDTVNVASRLESSTKELNKNILISKETYEAIKDSSDLSFEYLGEVHLKGRSHPIISYAVSSTTKE